MGSTDRQTLEVDGAPGLTLADLRTIAAAARAWLAERATEGGPEEWGDPALAQKYTAAMRGARVWIASGGVHAAISGPSWAYAASEALDAGSNAIGWRGAAYIADTGGASHLYFGTAAARELGYWHREHGQPQGFDASPPGIAAWFLATTAAPEHAAHLAAAYAYGATPRPLAVGARS